MSGSCSQPRRLTWKPCSPDGEMMRDIVEILHEIGVTDKELRKAAIHYVKTRFPEVNCTVSKANLGEFLGECSILQSNKGVDLNDSTGL